MKAIKLHYIFITFIISCFLLSCNSNNDNNNLNNNYIGNVIANKENKKVGTIVVTIHPLKLILQEIVGDKFEIITLLPIGISPHIFEPKPSDIKNISRANTLIFVSNNIDGWAAKYSNAQNILKINLMEYLVKNNKISNINNSNSINENFINSIDPHFWLSPQLVKEVANQICEVVQTIDTLNMQYYFTNTENFIKLLDSFHNELKSKLLPIKNKPIITAHNSFGYFIKEFQLTYGDCLEESPDKEITSKHFKEIVSKIKELKIKTIFSEKQINPQLINSVANNADVKVGILDPLGADKKIKTYFDLINWNANVMLKEL